MSNWADNFRNRSPDLLFKRLFIIDSLFCVRPPRIISDINSLLHSCIHYLLSPDDIHQEMSKILYFGEAALTRSSSQTQHFEGASISSLQHEAVPSIYFVPTHHSFFLSSLLIYPFSSACPCYSEPPLCINTVLSWNCPADFASHLLSIQFVMVLGLQIQIKIHWMPCFLESNVGKSRAKTWYANKGSSRTVAS